MIACYIRIIYILIGIDISENFYDKDGERFLDEVVNLKEDAVNNDVNKNHGYKNIMNETNHAYKII